MILQSYATPHLLASSPVAKDSGKLVLTAHHRDRDPEQNLRKSAPTSPRSISGLRLSLLVFFLRSFAAILSSPFYLCGFASLADVAKGGDGATCPP